MLLGHLQNTRIRAEFLEVEIALFFNIGVLHQQPGIITNDGVLHQPDLVIDARLLEQDVRSFTQPRQEEAEADRVD